MKILINRTTNYACLLALLALALIHPKTAQAAILESGIFTTNSGAGGTGGGTTNVMIFSDGTAWSGGAAGVVGPDSVNNMGNTASAGVGGFMTANTLFKFDIGSAVDGYNALYGEGNWTITNVTLSFQYTLYANNSRFGGGVGTFDTYWVANDVWQSTANLPIYAEDDSTLASWSTGQTLVADNTYYDWTTPEAGGTYDDLDGGWFTDKTGDNQSIFSYSLDASGDFLADLLSASASSDSNISLYLMQGGDAIGLCIFTGGGSTLPTLSFDVVAVPEPSTVCLLSVFGIAAIGLAIRRRHNRP